jgi:hypothetical protein
MINVLPQDVQDQLEQETTVDTKEPTVKPAQPTETPQPSERVLTAKDIMSSDTLKRLGAAVGDKVDTDNKLIRLFSKEEDAPKQFVTLTSEQIATSPRLQELGASAGDYIVDGKLQQRDYLNNWEQFKYAYDTETGLVGQAAQYLESVLPAGQLSFDWSSGFGYKSPDELYGKGFSDSTIEQRREMIDRKVQQDIADRYRYFKEDEDSGAALAGTGTAILTDPAMALPVAQGIKGAALTAGALSGGYSILDDLNKNQDIDTTKAALSTVVGLGAGAGGAKLVQAGQKLAAKSIEKSANKTIDEAEAVANAHIAAGGSQKGAIELLQQENIAPKLEAAAKIAGRKPVLKSSPETAQSYLDNMIANDSATSRLYSETLDKYLGTLSTQVKNISEPIFGRLRKFEFDTHVQTAEVMKKIDGFAQQFSALNTQLQSRIGRHIMNGEFKAATKLMPPSLRTEFGTVQTVLKDVRKEMIESGIEVGEIENYFPRIVNDVDGLLKSLGREEKSKITRAIEEYAKKNELTVATVPQDVKNDIADKVARGIYRKADAGQSRVQKERQIDTVTEDLEQYYASPIEALTRHLRGAVNDINRRKFFGRELAKNTDGKTNLDLSIGKLIQKQADEGNISAPDEDKLLELMQARFVGGEQTPKAALGMVRDIGYAGTIANPVSAVVQLGDIGLSGALHGFRNTIAGMFGAKNIKLVDLGLEQVIAQELANPSKTSAALHKLFKISGFQRIDRLGKETVINAAMKKNMKLAESAKGVEKLRAKWGKTFGNEFDSLIANLKNKEVTDNVKFLAFNELSDIQPISLSELPPAYLNNPNGRILYMLKSFTLKQYDVVRRNIVQEWNKGNKMTAVKNAALYAGYVTAANVSTQTVKDMMLGRDVRAEDIPDKSMWALLGVFGINQYMSDRYLRQGDIKGAAINLVTPATPIFDEAFTLGSDLLKGEAEPLKNTRPIPVVGPIVYSWLGGGAERYNERLD